MNGSHLRGDILLIDSNEGERRVLSSRLTDAGHRVHAAPGAAAGLVEARSAAYDVVLCELASEDGIDGAEVCRRLRAVPALRSVPIVLYHARARAGGASTGAEAAQRAFAAGCDGFVAKSQLESLEAVVQVSLRSKAARDDLADENRLLSQQVRTLREELARRGASAPMRAGASESLGASGRAEGVLVVDHEGIVRHADRGARELFGQDLAGLCLGTALPGSGLEAFVRDARDGRRAGFRCDLSARRDRPSRTLEASVFPIATDPRSGFADQRVVLIGTAGAGRPGSPGEDGPLELSSLIEAARSVWRPESVLGSGDSSRALREAVTEAAGHAGPILIHGQAGTGKRFVARVLHYTARASAPFLRLHCGALAAATLERELSGGLFERARGGTLLFEELLDLPPALQHRLARALREADGAPRVVATTTADLRHGTPRRLEPELRSLLAPGMLGVPTLEERIDDVACLARHFADRFAGPGGPPPFEEHVLWLFHQYDWPGNVAELASAVEAACARAHDRAVAVQDLPTGLRDLSEDLVRQGVLPAVGPSRRERAAEAPHLREAASGGDGAGSWKITESDPIDLDLYERKALLRALHNTGGDKLAAARLLRVGKSTLYRKLKRLGIS